MAPTDGEAQLLLATLLRRVGRTKEAQTAWKNSPAAIPERAWQAAIAREQALLACGSHHDTAPAPPAVVAMSPMTAAAESREKAA